MRWVMEGGPASLSMEVEEAGESAGAALIDVSFCGATPLVWRVCDIKKSRSLGVVGALVGSLARQPRQNVRLGRPLELLQEEVLMLEESGVAAASRHTRESEDEEVCSKAARQYQAGLESSYKRQCVLALEDKKSVLRRVMTEKENGADNSKTSIQDHLGLLDQAFRFPRSAMAVQLCTARAGFSHCSEERAFLSTDHPKHADSRSGTRFSVYRDLRSKGFYLTSAGKFGGDFLVYPGDPLRFHAHFIALCISMDEPLPVCDVLAVARLGSNVKKTVLLCSPKMSSEPGQDQSHSDVVYSSLQWSSMV